jgi:hypothetical protein
MNPADKKEAQISNSVVSALFEIFSSYLNWFGFLVSAFGFPA